MVQLQEFESPQSIFSEYSYFSSYSDSWLEHCEAFAENAINQFHLNDKSQVIEIASNDGYLLKYFSKRKITVLGIEPAKNIAKVAKSAGIPTLTEFFSTQLAQKLSKEKNQADLLIGNNVRIGGGSGVVDDIPDNTTVMGYPAVPLKEFLKKENK